LDLYLILLHLLLLLELEPMFQQQKLLHLHLLVY